MVGIPHLPFCFPSPLHQRLALSPVTKTYETPKNLDAVELLKDQKMKFFYALAIFLGAKAAVVALPQEPTDNVPRDTPDFTARLHAIPLVTVQVDSGLTTLLARRILRFPE
jgi:hypothetical protein